MAGVAGGSERYNTTLSITKETILILFALVRGLVVSGSAKVIQTSLKWSEGKSLRIFQHTSL